MTATRKTVISTTITTLAISAFISLANKKLLTDSLSQWLPLMLLWSSALLTTLFISIVPYLLLYAIPLDGSPEYQSLLKVCLSFASGGLLGDAFLHLIPEALSQPSSDPNHGLRVGLWIIIGFTTFFLVEKMVRLAKQESQTKIENNCNHSQTNNNCLSDNEMAKEECNSDGHKQVVVPSKAKNIKIAAYLNLIADLTHNFTDGLAIGSSFLISQNAGIVTGMAIMLHEIPHEIGDYAVLIKSGCSRRKAMQLQLLTAIGAVAGTVVSLAMGGFASGESTLWILPFTGGGFIYIATVSILPELTDEGNLKQSVKELVSLLSGIFLMTLIIV